VDDSDDSDIRPIEQIYDAVVSDDDFTEILVTILGYHPTKHRESLEPIDGRDDPGS